MKKDFIVAKVEASTDGSPYIYVTFKDQNEYYKSGDKQTKPCQILQICLGEEAQ
jgi:hypothetical protein